ncbi:Stigma-specific protein Stig1 [Corchorus capsularis]|uniref:Stigma-specific protein Stig1 n=1 Tax=Corchorus capsularis TaxID=210143 RepID=A0A1R3GC51_COCAP|nr:Stigma-specific protein Stig1 [Corchorus capsularis]
MASTIVNLIAILSITITLLLSLHPQATFSFDFNDDEEEYYVLDQPLLVPNLRSKSRFLSHTSRKKDRIRKGARCTSDPYYDNICNGVSVNNGTGILNCCKMHCRNILRDENNCGACGDRCNFGQRCCGGVCIDVMNNPNHCGKCDKQCQSGVPCEMGYCGYA